MSKIKMISHDGNSTIITRDTANAIIGNAFSMAGNVRVEGGDGYIAINNEGKVTTFVGVYEEELKPQV